MRILTTSHLTPHISDHRRVGQCRAGQYFVFTLWSVEPLNCPFLQECSAQLSSVLASQLVARAVGRFGLTWHWAVWRQAVSPVRARVRGGEWGWGEGEFQVQCTDRQLHSNLSQLEDQVGCPHIFVLNRRSISSSTLLVITRVWPADITRTIITEAGQPGHWTLTEILSLSLFPRKYSAQFTSRESRPADPHNDSEPRLVYSDQVFGRPPLSLGMT